MSEQVFEYRWKGTASPIRSPRNFYASHYKLLEYNKLINKNLMWIEKCHYPPPHYNHLYFEFQILSYSSSQTLKKKKERKIDRWKCSKTEFPAFASKLGYSNSLTQHHLNHTYTNIN